jgi:hypothetical protein
MMWKTTEICGCGCLFGGVSSSITQKIHKEIICRIPVSKNLYETFDEEGRLS